jgi:hypothetical protein
MKTIGQNTILGLLLLTALVTSTFAQTPKSITTPDKVETRLGTLEFKDGTPSKATVERVYDNLLRLYSPLEPFFTKEWRPGEIELVRK